jgi:thioredoxin 1
MRLLIRVVGIVIAISAVGCSKQEVEEPSASVPASPTSVVVLNESNFDSEVQDGVVLVDFWATWCGPCKMQGPIVEEVAEQVQGRAKVTKLDVDTAPEVAQRFNIRSIPTLVVFKNGKPEKQFVGVTKAETLVSAVTAALDSE